MNHNYNDYNTNDNNNISCVLRVVDCALQLRVSHPRAPSTITSNTSIVITIITIMLTITIITIIIIIIIIAVIITVIIISPSNSGPRKPCWHKPCWQIYALGLHGYVGASARVAPLGKYL